MSLVTGITFYKPVVHNYVMAKLQILQSEYFIQKSVQSGISVGRPGINNIEIERNLFSENEDPAPAFLWSNRPLPCIPMHLTSSPPSSRDSDRKLLIKNEWGREGN